MADKLDRDRLAKILAMTTSDVDAEALAAVRRANEILKGAGLLWSDVLASQNVVNITISHQKAGPGAFGLKPEDYTADEDWIAPHLKDRVIIETMFRAINANRAADPSSEFWIWVDNVYAHWQQHGSVTKGQYQALRRCYLRAVRSQSGE